MLKTLKHGEYDIRADTLIYILGTEMLITSLDLQRLKNPLLESTLQRQ